MKSGLTPLETRFCVEYVVDYQGGPALVRAGSTATYPDQQAYEMLRKPHIAREIERLIAGQNEKAAVNKQWIMNELVALYQGAKLAAEGVGTGKPNATERATALRALEKLGMHVDVNAFRAQLGLGNPDGSPLDLSGLDDEDLDVLERVLAKAALAGGGSSGEGETLQ